MLRRGNMRRGNIPRQIQLARACGVPSILARLGEALSAGTGLRGLPLMVVAAGHNLLVGQATTNDYPGPAYGPTIDAKLARLLTRARNLVNRTDPDLTVRAYLYGEGTALHAYKDHAITREQVEQARIEVEEYLRNNSLDAQEFARVLTGIINKVFKPPHGRIPQEEFSARLGIPINELPLQDYPVQKLIWFECRLNYIYPTGVIGQWPQTWINVFTQLSNLQDNAIHNQPQEPIPNIVQDPLAAWTAMTHDERLAWYEAAGALDENEHRMYIISSALTFVITMVKGLNFTDAWLARLLELSTQLVPQGQLNQILSADFIRRYQTLYPRENVDVDRLYACFLRLYSILGDDKVRPLRWIFEQAATSNMNLANALAVTLIRCPYVPYEQIERTVGTAQFRAIITLACWLYYDRFGTLLRPPVRPGEYPDLAYIGIEVHLKGLGGRQTTYSGKTAVKCLTSAVELNAIATQIAMLAREGVSEAFALDAIAKILYPEDDIVEIGGRIFRTPAVPANVPENLDPAEAAQIRAHIREQRRAQEDAQQVARAGWPKAARALAPGTVEVTITNVIEVGRNRQQARWRNFERFLEIIKDAGLDPIPGDRTNLIQRRRRLPDDLIAALAEWQVPVDPSWRADPPANNPIAPRNNDVNSNFYILSRRRQREGQSAPEN